MNHPASSSLLLTETWWKGIILALSAAVILFTIWCLANGITTIFMHLYYFPIVLLAYRYRWKGCGLATLLGLAYLGLVIIFEPGQPDVILGALYRFFVFVGIAAVVAYLSERLIEARNARHQSTELRERYLSLAPAIILALDRNGVITYLNENGGKILEYLPEEVVGKSWADQFLPEKDRERVNRVFSQMIAGVVEPNRVIENTVLARGGTGKIIRWHNTVMHDESGAITGVLGFGEDITEEKWAQDALQEMQQFQENVIANANVWISVLDPDGILLVWNDAAEAISGYKKRDVLGKKTVWRQLYPDATYRRKVTGDIQRVIGRDVFLENFETEIQCADQTKKTIVWNTRALHDNHGVITSYIAIGRDVTAQRSAELRAGESSRFLAAMIDTLPIPIFFKDTTGKYLGCNPPFAEYIGSSCDSLIGKTAYDISPKDLADKYTAADREVFDNPVSQRYETQVQYADGSRRDVIFYKAPFFNKDGSLGGLIGAFLDITDRKRMEIALKESESFNRGLVENLPDYIAVYGLDGNLLYVNPASAKGLGYDAGTLVGTHVLSYVAKEYHETVIAKMTARQKGGDTSPYEIEMITKNGPRRSVIVKATDIQYQNNPAILLLLIDITDRKQAEQSLRESEVKYRAFFTTSRDCVFITTLDGRWVDFNDTAVELLGYESREDLFKTKISQIYANSDERDAHIRYIREKGFSVEYPVDLKKKDGTILNTLITTVERKDAAGNTIGFQGSIRDITGTKAIQDRIKELLHLQEEQLRIINTSPAVAFLWKAEENWPVEMVSSNISQFGYSVDDFVSGRVPFSSIIHPEDLERVAAEVENNSKNIIDEFSQIYRILGKDGVEHWIHDYTHIRRDNEGIITHYEGIILDITDRKLAQEALRSSEERFRGITERIFDLIIIVDPEGYPTFVSPSVTSILGRPPEEFIGKRAGPDIIPAEDLMKIAQAMERLKNGSAKEQVEFRMLKGDGSLAVFEGSGIPVFTHGVYAGVQVVAHDISERKRAEDALRENEAYIKAVMDSLPIGVAVNSVDPAVTFTYMNDNFAKFYRTTREALARPDAFWDVVYEDPVLRETMKKKVLDDCASGDLERMNWPDIPITRKGEETTFVIARNVPVPDKKIMISTVWDVTYRKKVEELLRQNQMLLANAMDLALIVNWVFDVGTGEFTFDDRFYALYGTTAEREGGYRMSAETYAREFVHPDDVSTVGAEIQKLLATKDPLYRGQMEHRIIRRDGEIRMIIARYAPILNAQGNVFRTFGANQDITERKRVEEALRDSEEKFRMIFENSNDAILLMGVLENGMIGRIIDVNDMVVKQTGYTKEELLSGTSALIDSPDIIRKLPSILAELPIKKYATFESEVVRKDGTLLPIETSIRLIKIKGQPCVISMARDITDRKRAEEALHESRQLFSDIIRFLPDPTFVIDNDGKVLAWNRALEELSGVPAGEIIGKGDHEYSLWQYGKRRSILIDLVLHPDQDAARMNYTHIHSEDNTVTAQAEITVPENGHRIPVSLVASPLVDAQGKITGAIESLRDISRIRETEADLARMNRDLEQIVKDRTRLLEDEVAQRIRAEQDVQKALSYTRSVIESNPDLVTVLDENGIILDVNATGEIMTGMPKETLIGMSYISLLVDDGNILNAFSKLLSEGKIEYVIQVRRTDGHVTPLSVHASVIKGMDGGKDRIIVAAHDITRQKQDEESIRASLEEKVLLLREIHHRVKNNLQIIISLTNLQMRQTDDPAAKQIMAETQNRVRAMSLVHEKLYRSDSLSRIDFADYTRFLATQLFSYYGMDTQRVQLDMSMGKIMVDINAAVPLGLLMNELVSNALKHAFPDERKGTIRISGGDTGDLITLAVQDDGIGMPADLDWKNTTSLGMRLVTSLVDQVDGTITLDSNEGTTFTVTLKRKPES
ncbi:MAG: hypothetical protein CVV30_00800 [Methanomicrobiales archaeon HGW-Methanomicrobiales-1]|jgi:hypothetical protein|nr:MAG: hypothetical protein CVV30_00800 [Methanomicrobiales archaeon HGW-Methanomicrobiales-1]